MNTAGWLLTENGRQPWVVQGLLLTEDGNSPSVSLTEVAVSLGIFVVLYLVLGIVWALPDAALRQASARARTGTRPTPTTARAPPPRHRRSRTEVY